MLVLEICRFDESVPRLLRVLYDELGHAQVENGVVLRDVTGRLSFFSRAAIDPVKRDAVVEKVHTRLGPYARQDRQLVGPDEPGARKVLDDPGAQLMFVDIAKQDLDDVVQCRVEYQYLDRRIVGADWLRRPIAPSIDREQIHNADERGALRLAFASLKGGVGRTTALTVVAADQARKGRNVLVLDLDLEAPGVGSLLLTVDRMPPFGAIDFLVERNFGPVDRVMVDEMMGTSALTQGQGLVNVVPAIGSRTLEAPANYLAKLSRAMIEAVSDEGEPVSLAGKLREMLEALEATRRYDLVLIDVRAGLAELTAGPLLALNTEVLLFGTDQQQTLQDLRFLFAHLASLTGAAHPSEWDRLKMVQAKAVAAARVSAFRDAVWDLFSTFLYVEAVELDAFNFDADVVEAPHYPIVIPLDTAFADWDPVASPDKLSETYYARTFGDLLEYVDDLFVVDTPDGQS
jgi:cellulose biosynthesis protein BcsQ